MPKDALTIYRAAEELDMLIGGRVDKVNMPSADTLTLLMHTTGHGNHRLLLSCNPSLPRAHITEYKYNNPETATGTLMYFRKRLTGAVLIDIVRDKCERMIRFDFTALDELRERVEYKLYVELTGKCANIVFVDKAGVIGNCLRKISSEAEGKRAVLIGLDYTLPNPTGRVGVFDVEALKAAVASFTGISARTAVNKCVAGLATTTVDEVFSRAGLDPDAPATDETTERFALFAQSLYDIPVSPVVTFDEADGKPIDYFIAPYSDQGGRSVSYPSVNAAMDAYYSGLFAAADLATYSKPLRAAVRSAVAKNKKRLADASNKLAECDTAESDRMIGDLITANIYKIKRGDTAVTVENFYDDNKPVTIKLDVTKNAQQNAAAHYKAYTKKKRAYSYATDAMEKAKSMLYTLDGISTELDLCSDKRELDEVRAELVSLSLLRPDNKRKKAVAPSEPYKFEVDGAEVLVGKNSAQNDRITRGAARTDTWLHVKDAHGSHVVLKTPSPTPDQLTFAAQKAAYYSQSRNSENVAVDYTLIKFVYPHGGGHVDYKEYKTLYVTPKP